MDVAKLHKSLDSRHKKFIEGLDSSLIEKITLDRNLFVSRITASIEEILKILKECGAIDVVEPKPFDKFVDSVVLFEISKNITPNFSPTLQIKAEFPDKVVFAKNVIYVDDGSWEEIFANCLLDYIHVNFFQSKQYTDMLISKRLGALSSKRKKK